MSLLKKGKDKSTAPRTRSAKPSINILILSIIPIILGIAACLGCAYMLLAENQVIVEKLREDNDKQVLDTLAAQFTETVRTRQFVLTQMSSSPQLISAIKAGIHKSYEQNIKPAFPDAIAVRLFQDRIDRQLDSVPPIGESVKEMARYAMSNTKPPKPEVHFPGGKNEHINFLQPVTETVDDKTSVIGFILVSYPSSLFKDILMNYKMPVGFARIVYKAPNNKLFDIVEKGDSSLSSTVCDNSNQVSNLPVRVCYQSKPAPSLIENFALTTLLTIVGVAAAVILIASLIPIFIIKSLIQKDGKTLLSLFEDLHENRLQHQYSAILSDLSRPVEQMYEIAVDIKTAPAIPGTHPPAELAKDDEQPAPLIELPPDTLSGLEVEEELPPEEEEEVDISFDAAQEEETQPQNPALEKAPAEPAHAPMEFSQPQEPPASAHKQGGTMAERDGPEIPSLLIEEETPDSDQSGTLNKVPDFDINMVIEDPASIPANIFRAYDIRGIAGKELTPGVVKAIGQAIGTEAIQQGHTAIITGRDGRLSGPELLNALNQGLQSTGLMVINIGEVPTPVMYFATFSLGTGAGVELTGSHNPGDYNGMKIMLGGKTLSGDAIQALYKRAQNRDFISGIGNTRNQDIIADYLDRIVEDVSLHRPLKVVIDCGNGVAGAVAPKLFKMLGCDVESLFCDVNGHFPHHHPDPSEPENLDALISLVRLQNADIGLAFDGDGDRLGIVDAEGNIIWPDRQMMLFAIDVLSRNPGSDIIFDVKCTSKLAHVITENAGVPVMWKTGHSLIKSKLAESGAPLAGEMSGHIFFSERWYGFDDALYAGARLLEIISSEDRSSTEIFADLPDSVNTPELKVHLNEGEPALFMRDFIAKVRFDDAKISTIDGIRADFIDGWGLVRASNTTPCLVLRFDGDNQEALDRIKEQFREQMLSINSDLELPF